jgi:hypothetical protein
MSEQKKQAETAVERVALFVELYDHPNLGAEIVSDDRFRSDAWPRRMYALDRKDVVEVLKDLASAEEMNALQRKDIEELQAKIEDMKEEQDRYEENIVGDMNEQAINDARKIAELEKMIASMRLNGARHHFVFAYDKFVEAAGKRLQFCGDCDKEKGHPAHFAQDARYLDSREVEKCAEEAQERLCNVLVDGMKLNHRAALNTARELLQGLPGIRDFQSVPGRPKVDGAEQPTKGINTNPRRCNAGCGFHEDNHDNVTVPFPHDFSWGSVPRPKRSR